MKSIRKRLRTPALLVLVVAAAASVAVFAVSSSTYAAATTYTRVSVDASGGQADGWSGDMVVSRNGQFVAFVSNADNLVPGDTPATLDVFRKNLQTGTVVQVNTDSGGTRIAADDSTLAISANGRYVAYKTDGSPAQVNVKDMQTGAVIVASSTAGGTSGNGSSAYNNNIQMSDDGTYIVFDSQASNLVPNDTNSVIDVFRKNILTGDIKRASTDASGGESAAGSGSWYPSISADGRYVAFGSSAATFVLPDTNAATNDIYVKDMQTGAIVRASATAAGVQSSEGSYYAAISADGQHVIFMSAATDLISGASSGDNMVYSKNLQTGTLSLVSSDAAGDQGNDWAYPDDLSSDGRYVLFESAATNLLADSPATADGLFMKDTQTGTVSRISPPGANDKSWAGQFVATAGTANVIFLSDATNIVADDTNASTDIFLAAAQTPPAGNDNGATTSSSSSDNVPGAPNTGLSRQRSLPFIAIVTGLIIAVTTLVAYYKKQQRSTHK